jgi:predicted nucleic acid-binding protein
MNLLIDSNVILDMVQHREPFFRESKEIIAECIKQSHFGFVTAHSLCDIYYILRKDMSAEQRLKLVNMFCQFFTVIPETASDFAAVTENPDTEDLEDGLQQQRAARLNLDYIVTRNIDDFGTSTIPAIEPGQFLSKFF